jgi:hypothetical protein
MIRKAYCVKEKGEIKGRSYGDRLKKENAQQQAVAPYSENNTDSSVTAGAQKV